MINKLMAIVLSLLLVAPALAQRPPRGAGKPSAAAKRAMKEQRKKQKKSDKPASTLEETQKPGDADVSEPAKKKTVIHLKYAKARDMAVMLQIMLPDITVYAHDELNALEIYDTVEIIQDAQDLIDLSDLPKRQVIIELKAIETSHTRATDVGWEIKDWSVDLQALLPPEVLEREDLKALFPGSVHMEDTGTNIKILATPKIMITNRQKAYIHIGERIPYETVVISGGKERLSVEFVDVGIKLRVTPTIYINDEIDLVIEAEISSVGKRTAAGNPEVGTRTTDTTIHMKNKYTAVLGGMVKEEIRSTRSGVPLLSRIPLLGIFFGRTKYEKLVTEVRISLTPRILSLADEATIE